MVVPTPQETAFSNSTDCARKEFMAGRSSRQFPFGSMHCCMEMESKTKMTTDAPIIWRFATGVGEESDKNQIEVGWMLEE